MIKILLDRRTFFIPFRYFKIFSFKRKSQIKTELVLFSSSRWSSKRPQAIAEREKIYRVQELRILITPKMKLTL